MTKRGIALGGRYSGIYEKTLKDGSKRYTVLIKYRKPNGKIGHRTQTATSLREALFVKKKGHAKKALGTLSAPQHDRMSLGKMAEIMKAIKQDNKDVANPVRYLNEILDFFGAQTWLEDIDEVRINAFKKDLSARWKRSRGHGRLSNRSKDHRLAQLKNLLITAMEKGYLKRVPKIRLYGNYGHREYNLNLEKFGRLLKEMPEPPRPHRAILLVGLITGQRRTDLLRMRKKQIADGRIRFRSSKTGREFVIPCPAFLTRELEKLPEPHGEWLFPNPVTGEPYKDLRVSLATASHYAGIVPPVTHHMIRHLAADEVAKLTGNKLFTQQYIGWSSAEMVDRYTHVETWTTPIVHAFDRRIQAVIEPETGVTAQEKDTKGCTQVVPFAVRTGT